MERAPPKRSRFVIFECTCLELVNVSLYYTMKRVVCPRALPSPVDMWEPQTEDGRGKQEADGEHAENLLWLLLLLEQKQIIGGCQGNSVFSRMPTCMKNLASKVQRLHIGQFILLVSFTWPRSRRLTCFLGISLGLEG
jgi:hypothetical protein